MKKLGIAMFAGIVLCAYSSWAQTTNVTKGINLVMQGKLSPSGATVTGADLTGNTNVLSFLHAEIINGTTTNIDRWIGQINGTTTNLLFHQHGHIDYTASTNMTYKFALGFIGNGHVGVSANASSNALFIISGLDIEKIGKNGKTNETVNAAINGIWVAAPTGGGGQAISGTVVSPKLATGAIN